MEQNLPNILVFVIASESDTGTYMRKDYKKAMKKAKENISCFEDIPQDSGVDKAAASLTELQTGYLIILT